MNGPFVVAQANTGGASATPVQVLKLIKPKAGETDIMHASFTGAVKIDFTAIANETITLFHDSKNQSLHVIFADGSQIVIEPFFDSRGTILANLILEMGPNQFYSGEQFAQAFTISEDPTVLPAAGPGGTAAGADFHDAAVDALGLSNPLGLLGPEELPGINFTVTQAPVLAEEAPPALPPLVITGPIGGIVEEEQLTGREQQSDAGQGNEDVNDANALDTDENPPDFLNNVSLHIEGELAGIVSGGTPPFSFALINPTLDGIAENDFVHDASNARLHSLGADVKFVFVSPTEIQGWADDGGNGSLDRLVFTLTLDTTTGHFEFDLNDQIDHPLHSHDDGTNPAGVFEELLSINLSSVVEISDSGGQSVNLGNVPGAPVFAVGVIDDTPVLGCLHDGEGGDEGGDQQTQFAGDRHPGEGGNALINGLGGPAGFGEQFALNIGDDNSSGFVDVTSIFPAGMNFFGTTYDGFYINNNGNITFGSSLGTFTPFALTGATGIPIIAPFFADVDTRGPAGNTSPGGTSMGSNRVHLDFDVANGVITITWDDVGYYGSHSDLVNAFQLVIYNTGGENFSFEFRYENVDWTTGDASGGSNGLGGVVTRAGWNSGDGTEFFELPQSGNQSAILALETTSNPGTAQDGNWVFNVVGGQVTGGCTTTVAVDEDDLNQFDIGTSTYQGNNDVAPGDDLPAPSPVSATGDLGVLYGADGPGELIGVQYTGPALTSHGKPVAFVQDGAAWYGRVLDDDPATPGDQPRDVFKFEVNFGAQTFTFTLLDNLDHPLTDDPSTPATETSFEDNLLLQFGVTVSDYDGDDITTTVSVNVDDDTPTVEANNFSGSGSFASVVLDESVGNDATNPGDTTQSNPPGDDTGAAAPTFPLPVSPHAFSPFGSAIIDGSVIETLFSASPGADGEGDHAFGFVLKDADGNPAGTTFVQTNLTITDFTATGDATPVFGDDTIYLVQISDTEIWGVVAGVDGDITNTGDNQLALRFTMQPSTGEVTVEQFLAIHHDIAGSDAAAFDDPATMFVVGGEGQDGGGIFVSYELTDGDDDSVAATSAAPLSVTIEDDGINVDVAQATTGEGSGSTVVSLDTLFLDESIAGDSGPDSNSDGALDDNPPVTAPSYLTLADSTKAIGHTSTPTDASGVGTSIASLFTITKAIGSDGLADENKAYSLTLTDAQGNPVLSGSTTGVLTNLHVTDTGGSPVAGSSEGHRAISLFKISDTEIVGLMGQDTPGDSDDFVALRILLSAGPDPVLTVEQYLPLEHPLTGTDHFDESVFLNFAIIGGELDGGSLGVTLTDTVTDGDGDTSTDSQTVTLASAADSNTSSGTSLITFEDDGPSSATVSVTSGTLIHDETPGVDAGSDDVAPSAFLDGLFASVANKGNDPDVADPVSGAPVIGYAQDTFALSSSVNYGTDGPGAAVQYALALSADNVLAGLQTTDGHDIRLVNEGGIIVGRVDSDADGSVTDGDAGDQAAFAMLVDSSTGELTVVQYLSIKHDDRGDNDESNDDGTDTNDAQPTASLNDSPEPIQQFLATGTVSLVATFTDGDGDKATASTDISNRIIFEDDGPSLNIVDAPNSVIETQSINGTWTLAEGADGVTSVDVTVGLITKTLLIPSGVLGADPITHVTFTDVEGAFGTLNVYSDGSWTYAAGPVSGDQSFSFSIIALDGDGDPASDSQTITIHDTTTTLQQSGTFTGTVEEEQLGHVANPTYAASFVGNEDTTAGPPDNDFDTANSGPNSLITREFTSDTFIVFGGTGPFTYHFAPSGIEGTQAQFTNSPNPMTSHGAPVLLHVDGNTLYGYTDDGTPGYTEGVDHVVFTFQLNPATGQGTFTLYDNVDHHTVPAADGVEGTRSLNLNGFVQVTDSSLPSPQTISLNGSVGIIDDIPVATNNTATVNEGGTASTNFVLILDRSASMLDDPGVPGFATRFALEKAAAINLLNSANVNQVFLVGFSNSASDSGGWLSKAQAISFITFMAASGQTNYDAALTDAQTAFDFGHTNATQTLAYFLSDGQPNLPIGSVGIDASEQTAWENFLNTNGFAESFAVGIGNGATLSTLEPIAYPNGDPNNPVVLTDQSQLSDTLIGGLPGVVDGNVLTTNSGSGVDGFGADGPGAGAGILSITVDGHLYAYNAGTNAITKDGNPFAAGTGTLDLATTLGGHLTFHFTSGVGFDAGDWHYQSPNNVPNNSLETFHYVIADGDGDQAGADLSITITANDAPHANFDMVLTNFDGVAFNVPEWAFLHNDSDPNGTPIDVAGVLNISDLVVNHTPGVGTNGFITIDDEDTANGGSFDYTITNGTLSDTASVSVSNLNGGGNITGTSAAEILVGDGNSNTFNGAGGGDVILAGAGDDILIGGGGADYMQGDAGADHFRYNATSEGGVFFNQLGADHILDFSAADSIDILASAFGGGLVAGTDATGPGVFGSSADNTFGSATERFHFNTATNTLLYDSNGSTAGGTQVALAVLENSTVGAAQIHMV